MKERHRLLERQLKRHYNQAIPPEWEKMIESVNNAYWESDDDRKMLERALELSSQELLQANSEMRAIIQSFPDVFLRVDDQGIVLSSSGCANTDLYPWSRNPVGNVFYKIFGEGPATKLESAVKHVFELETEVSIEFELQSDLELRCYEARLLPILGSQIFVIIRDISERKQAEQQLIYLSMFDPLTGLYNRAYFEKEMHRLQTDYNDPVGMLICDVDNLKMINDTHGHERGDALLVEVARVLKQSLRKHDVIARIGGDEFAILLPNTDGAAVENTYNRIRIAIDESNKKTSGIPLSISIGYSVRNYNTTRMDEIFKEADDNMYKEKYKHHKSLSASQIHTMFDMVGTSDFAIQGRHEQIDQMNSDLILSVQRSIDETDQLDLRVHLYRTQGEGSFIVDPAIPSAAEPGEYRNFLRSLITLLNVAFDALPPKK
ncbi:MAG TPA: diguanylate cyclase [Syntrophomonadaceae bacterium]|nr:diguanylate cyclase [Syntrophomonadaceae bacterium]